MRIGPNLWFGSAPLDGFGKRKFQGLSPLVVPKGSQDIARDWVNLQMLVALPPSIYGGPLLDLYIHTVVNIYIYIYTWSIVQYPVVVGTPFLRPLIRV